MEAVKFHLKKLLRFCFDRVNRILLLVVIGLLLMLILLFKVGEKRVKASLAEQMLYREQVIARAGARSIEHFLSDVGRMLRIEAVDAKILGFGSMAEARMDEMIGQWQDTALVDLILVDEKGEVLYVTDKEGRKTSRLGTWVDDRDYFLWGQTAEAGDVFIGEPIKVKGGSYKDQSMVPVVVSIIKNGQFKGVLGGGVLLSELIEEYLEPLRISDKTQAHLLNFEDKIIGSTWPDFVGTSLAQHREADGWNEETARGLEALVEEVDKTGEGRVGVRLKAIDGEEIEQVLLAVSTIYLNNFERDGAGEAKRWFLTVETPRRDILSFFASFKANLMVALTFFLFSILTFSFLLILIVRITQRDSYEEGFRKGRGLKKK